MQRDNGGSDEQHHADYQEGETDPGEEVGMAARGGRGSAREAQQARPRRRALALEARLGRVKRDPEHEQNSPPDGHEDGGRPTSGFHEGNAISRDELVASYRRLLAGDVGQIVSALYSYGARLVEEHRAGRDDAPGQRPGAPCTVPTFGESGPFVGSGRRRRVKATDDGAGVRCCAGGASSSSPIGGASS